MEIDHFGEVVHGQRLAEVELDIAEEVDHF